MASPFDLGALLPCFEDCLDDTRPSRLPPSATPLISRLLEGLASLSFPGGGESESESDPRETSEVRDAENAVGGARLLDWDVRGLLAPPSLLLPLLLGWLKDVDPRRPEEESNPFITAGERDVSEGKDKRERQVRAFKSRGSVRVSRLRPLLSSPSRSCRSPFPSEFILSQNMRGSPSSLTMYEMLLRPKPPLDGEGAAHERDVGDVINGADEPEVGVSARKERKYWNKSRMRTRSLAPSSSLYVNSRPMPTASVGRTRRRQRRRRASGATGGGREGKTRCTSVGERREGGSTERVKGGGGEKKGQRR